MPLKYAIVEYIPKPGVNPKKASRWDSEAVYHLVSKEEAVEAEPNGVVAVFNNSDEIMTGWCPLKTEEVDAAFSRTSAAPLKDRLGNELAVGDFVIHCESEGTSLYIAQVAGFTKRNVRLINFKFSSWSRTRTADPNKVVRISPETISQ